MTNNSGLTIYSSYLKDIQKTCIKGKAAEGSYCPYLKALIENCVIISREFVGITVQPKKTELGIPDFLIREKHNRVTGSGILVSFPTDLSLEQLKTEQPSWPHNRLIAEVFFCTGYIEKWVAEH